MSGDKRTYWATWDGEDLANHLAANQDRFRSGRWSPLYDSWIKNTYLYYSCVLDSQSWMTSLDFGGEQGELVGVKVPEARRAVRDRVALITKQKLAFNALAMAEGTDVAEEMRIANAVCESTVTTQRLDRKQSLLAELGAVTGTSFISVLWRSDKGSPRIIEMVQDELKRAYVPDEQVLYDGDVEVRIHHLSDVFFNCRIEEWEDTPWADLRVRMNRWSLIAQHPDLADEIMRLPSTSDSLRLRPEMLVDEQDMVWVYLFFHRPQPGLDQGRMFIRSSPETVYYDDVNPYGTIPIERYMPEPIFGMGYGYPQLSNLLPSQEMLDHEFSSIASNHAAFGVQNIATPKGSEVEVQQLYGLNLFKYNPVANVPGGGKPEPLQLTQSSPESFKFADMCSGKINKLSGLNDAIRGDVAPTTSGVSIATQTANALEFMNADAQALQSVMEATMMHVVRAYRAFAKVERLVRMTGKNYQTYTKKFTGDMLAPIQAIKLQTVNPLMQTIAGRMDIATNAIKTGLVTSLSDYVSILEGQPLSTLFEADQSQNDLIASENEQLAQGAGRVFALKIDNHALHIFKHKMLLNDPRMRANGPQVAAILAHIEEHEALAMTTSPILQAMANTGKMPEAAAMAPPPELGPGGPEGAPEAVGPGGPGQPNPSEGSPGNIPEPEAQPAQPARDLLRRGA